MGNGSDGREVEWTAPSDLKPPDSLLGAIIDLTDDAVLTCDALANVTYVSRHAERLFGRPPEDLLRRPVMILFPGHLRDEMAGVFSTVVAGERIQHFETEIVRPDGLPVPVSFSLAPLTSRGRVVGSVVVARDVTEQHLAQATLAEMDARLEEAEALSHVGSWLWDFRTGAVQWSAEFHRIHGIDPLDFAGTFESYLERISLEDRTAVRTAMNQSVCESRSLDLEYRVVDVNRKARVVWVHANPTLGSDGRPVGLRGIGQDVTDQAS